MPASRAAPGDAVTEPYLAATHVVTVVILVVCVTIFYAARLVTRSSRQGYSVPARLKRTTELASDSSPELRRLIGPQERALEPLSATAWGEYGRQSSDADGAAPADPGRWLLVTSTRILVVRSSDEALEAEIPLEAITNLGLAPLPGNSSRKRSGIAIQADMPDGHRRWLWSCAAAEAPGWVIKAREMIAGE